MRSRPPVALAFVALLALAAGCVAVDPTDGVASTPTGESWTVTVTDVADGDTMDVRFADGRTDTVRLLGVDTPEVHVENDPTEFEGVPDSAAGRDHLRAWGERASDYATTRLEGRTVTIAVDPASDRRGGYDRLLVYLRIDGDLFNLALLERGYARHYDSEHSRRDAFVAAESRAREDGEGLWGYPATPSATWTVTPDGTDSETDSETDSGTATGSEPPTGTETPTETATPTASNQLRRPTHARPGPEPGPSRQRLVAGP